jgi:transcriptional regulator with XRE-family HTH domain
MTDEKQTKTPDGLVAVGAYLRSLREAAGISVAEIADKVGIDTSQIWRIEKGKSDPRSSFLFRFIKAVDGSTEDVARLINNAKATAADGEALAKLRRELGN